MTTNETKRILGLAFLLLAVGVVCLYCAGHKQKIATVTAPVEQIAATDEATKTIRERVDEARKERAKLPEVIRGAKEAAVNDIGALDDNSVADRWNGLLGRYREGRAAAGGVCADE